VERERAFSKGQKGAQILSGKAQSEYESQSGADREAARSADQGGKKLVAVVVELVSSPCAVVPGVRVRDCFAW